MKRLKETSAIVGHGMTIWRPGEKPWPSPLQMQTEACHTAMRDAGISREQVGMLLTARAPAAYRVSQFNMRLVNELKIAPIITSEVTSHGAGTLGMLQLGSLALQAGVVDYVLCSSGGAASPDLEQLVTVAAVESDPQFEAPFGPITPSLYALAMRRFLHDTGATKEQCARVAVESRRWALEHPLATMTGKGSITVEDVLNSPVIASPLNRLDCAPWFNGGISTALVLTRSELAGSHSDAPIHLLGWGQRATHEWMTERLGLSDFPRKGDAPNLSYSGAWSATRDAYAMSGLTPNDVDLAQTSAPFSFLALMMLEEFGFCERGDAGSFVESGGIDMESGRAFNTSGGYLSFGQSAQGMYLLVETIEQLLGRARGRQVPGAQVGLVHAHGGPMACHSVVLISPNVDAERS